MNEFQMWYVYFDSIFLKSQFRPTKLMLQSFFQELSKNEPWPMCSKIVEIGECFSLLEDFIRNPRNWHADHLDQSKRKRFEAQINNILIMLLIEKQYANELWQKSNRRIQASICHLFIFIEQFILALIPDSKLSLFECKHLDILCTDIFNIQTLMNQLIAKFNALHKFMFKNQFKEQKSLTKALFNSFADLFNQLPKIKGTQLRFIPKLLEYVNIINPIQISKRKFVQEHLLNSNRPKACTVGTLQSNPLLHPFYINIRFFNGFYYQLNSKSKSSLAKIQSASNIKQKFIQSQLPLQFKFNITPLRKPTPKNPTASTIQPESRSREKTTSVTKKPSIGHSLMEEEPIKNRNKQQSFKSSQKSLKRKRKRSTHRIIIRQLVGQQQENQRGHSVNSKSKNGSQLKQLSPIKYDKKIDEQTLTNLNEGGNLGHWNKIKQHVNEKIIEKKIRKLIRAN